MAPNVRIIHPQQEVLIQQPGVSSNDNSHGTHKVNSNYPKRILLSGQQNVPNFVPSASPSPMPEVTTHRSGNMHKTNKYEISSSYEDDSREFIFFEKKSHTTQNNEPTPHRDSLVYIEEMINKYPEAFQIYMTENHPPEREFQQIIPKSIQDSVIQETAKVPIKTVTQKQTTSSTTLPSTTVPTSTRMPKKPRKSPVNIDVEIPENNLLDSTFHSELPHAPNLHHHEKTLAELAQNEVAIRDESDMSHEARTAVILVGMCSIIMIIICFLFMIGKWKDKKPKKKIPQDAPEKPKPKSIWDTQDNAFVRSTLAVATPPVIRIPYGVQTSKPKKYMSPIKGVEVSQAAQVGCLWFSARYDPEKSDLHLSVLHARYPQGRDLCDEPGEVFIEALVITPMNKVKASDKTTTRRATRSPVFNHSFSFLILEEDIKTCILKLVLHDKHPEKGDILAGTVIVPLSSVDIYSHDIYCRDFL